jgi:hypothetical protein
VITIPAAAAAMIPVGNQPMIRRPPAIANLPIIALFEVMSIIIVMRLAIRVPIKALLTPCAGIVSLRSTVPTSLISAAGDADVRKTVNSRQYSFHR